MAKTVWILAVGLTAAVSLAATTRPASGPYESTSAPAASDNPIDKIVFARLDKLGIARASLCSDAVFVRRAYLDVIGTLPTEGEARDFIDSKEPAKRIRLIDQLMDRDEFATYWAMKWSELLRVKAEFPINLWPNAAQGYHHWIRTSIAKNKPYDQFVRELLTSNGSNFRVPPVNFYRAMQDRGPSGIAQTVALTFMGCRADKWPKERLESMAVFFSQVGYKSTGEWKEEIVFFDSGKVSAPATGKSATQPAFPDGAAAKIPPGKDGREVFADWLIDTKNSYFTKNIANRVWSWLMGRGIIHEPDDIRPDNPPTNPELLACLEKELVSSKYDLRRLYRLILTSQAYQLSSIATSSSPEAAANFASYPLRRLEAEVLMDALCQITGTTEKYSSPIPEPFTFIPEYQRSISLPDGSITSSFLEMFGRAARDTGYESERSTKATAAQKLFLLNSSRVQAKIEQGRKLQPILRARGPNWRPTITDLYLLVLSRYPTQDELSTAEEYIKSSGADTRGALVDLTWALINSAEFQYRH